MWQLHVLLTVSNITEHFLSLLPLFHLSSHLMFHIHVHAFGNAYICSYCNPYFLRDNFILQLTRDKHVHCNKFSQSRSDIDILKNEKLFETFLKRHIWSSGIIFTTKRLRDSLLFKYMFDLSHVSSKISIQSSYFSQKQLKLNILIFFFFLPWFWCITVL